MTDSETSIFGKDEKRFFFFLFLIEVENCRMVVTARTAEKLSAMQGNLPLQRSRNGKGMV